MDEQQQDKKLDEALTEDAPVSDDNKSEIKDGLAVSLDHDDNQVEKPSENTADLKESEQHVDPSESVPEPIAEPIRPISAGLPRVQRRADENPDFSIILRSRGRAFSQALMTFAGTKQRSGRLWLTFAIMLIVIALLIIQVAYKHRELNLGFELSDAITQREALLEENRKLRIELRVLSRRERLEPLAGRQLGMSVIKPEQIFIVDTKGRLNTSDKPGKRADGLDNVRHLGEE